MHGFLAWLAAVHGGLLIYDLRHPARFTAVDGAGEQLERIQALVRYWHADDDVVGFVLAQGAALDWLPQALLYIVAGPPLVIAVQALLAVASVAWVRGIGLRLGLAPGKANAVAALYGALPHTVVAPHQLAPGAILVPLMVLAFALAARARSGGEQAEAGAATGLAVLLQPALALWPPMHALLVRHVALVARLGFLVVALLPVALWSASLRALAFDLPLKAPVVPDAALLAQAAGIARLGDYLGAPAAAVTLAVSVGVVLFAALVAFSALGALALARQARFLLPAYVLYVYVALSSIDAALFALCLLAGAGVAALVPSLPGSASAPWSVRTARI